MSSPQGPSPDKPDKRPLRIILLLAGVLLIVSLILFLRALPRGTPAAPTSQPKTDEEMVIQLAESCAPIQKVLSNTPLILAYGYWGFLPEYTQQNLDSLFVEIYINGELAGSQEDTFEVVPTTLLPCVDLNEHSTAFAESGQWAYAALKHPGLPRGEYQVEIIYYLRQRLATGLTDANGELIFFGPGEIQRLYKELAVE